MNSSKLILFNSLLNDNLDLFINKLFNYKSLINKSNRDGETLLHYCVHFGLIEQYYALINIGAKFKITKFGNNILHYASNSGKDDFLITELVKNGISPLDKNIIYETSLHCSANARISHYFNMWCLRNNINIVKLLDINNNTIAHSCNIHGHYESAYYWVKNYPELSFVVNNLEQKWNNVNIHKNIHGLY